VIRFANRPNERKNLPNCSTTIYLICTSEASAVAAPAQPLKYPNDWTNDYTVAQVMNRTQQWLYRPCYPINQDHHLEQLNVSYSKAALLLLWIGARICLAY